MKISRFDRVKTALSLISEKDRIIVTKVLKKYIKKLSKKMKELDPNSLEYKEINSEFYELNTLIQWVNMEFYKKEKE